MKDIYRNTLLLICSFFVFLLPTLTEAATTASASFTGNGSTYVGNNIEITLVVSESGSKSDEGVAGIQGPLTFDTSKLELVSTKSHNLNVSYNSGKIIGMANNESQYLRGSKNVMTFTFKAKTLGETSVSINVDLSDAAGDKIFSKTVSKKINITNPPSGNTYLKTLSVSEGTLNFNKNTTNYNVSVDSDVTSITIDATPEDTGATVSGTGRKNLSYGNNKFDITVKAPSGAQKTYTVNVNRKDIRSSNNNLASLTVSDGELNPNFNKNTTSYTLSVPFSVSNLKVDAKAEDTKATVKVSGNDNLVSEQTRDVKVTVTAENGSEKVYVIKVTRGKDPNKKLSTNNYLASLNASIGILSPAFDKEVTNYAIYLPYEVDKITFEYTAEDTQYASVKLEGNETLQAGTNNIYKIIVTAESGEERTYQISVSRANKTNNSDDESNSNQNSDGNGNIYLQKIELTNGSLVGEFDKKTHEYYYKRKKGFEIKNIVAEDSNSVINTFEDGNDIYIIVSNGSNQSVYVLREKQFEVLPIIINVTLFATGAATSYIVPKIILKTKKK